MRKFFAEVLGSPPEEIPGTTMLVCRLAEGTSVSVEFTPDALDDVHALRGAWLEIRTDDPAALQGRVMAAGLARVEHQATSRFYFRSPDGQVWGIAELRAS
ncbi:MAG: VOC family protein [Gemmatimonadaceae bacterium]